MPTTDSGSPTLFLGAADTTETLKGTFLSINAGQTICEYALQRPECGTAIVIRCQTTAAALGLETTDFVPQPALDVNHAQLDFEAHWEAWMGVLSLADPSNRRFSFNMSATNKNLKLYAQGTLCSLATRLPNRDAWIKATLHGSTYLTFDNTGETVLLPAPADGFICPGQNTPVVANATRLQPALLVVCHRQGAVAPDVADENDEPDMEVLLQALSADSAEPEYRLAKLPAIWPTDQPTQRCDGLALLHIYLSDNKQDAQLREREEENLEGFTHQGQFVANVHDTLPSQLYELIEQHCSLTSITVSIYETKVERDATTPGFLHAALPGWALPPAPLLFNWSQTPDPSLDDWLPGTTGFDYTSRATATDAWVSPCHLLADRNLAIGEALYVFVQDVRDGSVLHKVSLKATANNSDRNLWPSELAQCVNDTVTHTHARIQIGNDAAGVFGIAEDTPDSKTFAAMGGEERNTVNRFWGHGSSIRVTSTAPFMANTVCALPLPVTDLLPDTRLCVQVRDATSQRLLENHLFTPAQTCLESSQWPQALCHFLNARSEWLRAGRPIGQSAWIVPSAKGNGIWIPQESDLSVTIQPLHWQQYAAFTASEDLEEAQRITLYAHDPATGKPMPGSPLVFIPRTQDYPKTAWPAALAKAIEDSALSDYLRLGSAEVPGSSELDSEAEQGVWWTPNLALRIWFDDPQGQTLDWQAVPGDDEQPLQLSSLYQAPYGAVEVLLKDRRSQMVWGYLSYTPELNGQAHDKASWLRGLYDCLRTQKQMCLAIAAHKPEVNQWDARDSDCDQWKLWAPRQADLELTLHAQPARRLEHIGQWPNVQTYLNSLTAGQEYLIHGMDAKTGQAMPGSPITFVATARTTQPVQWVAELGKVLKSVSWGAEASIVQLSTYIFKFSNSSSSVLVSLDPKLMYGGWEEAKKIDNQTPARVAELYKTPTTAIVVNYPAKRQQWKYVPATDGSVTDRRSWLRGFYNMLYCQARKGDLNFIAVSRQCPGHSIWDMSDPESCKIWLMAGSGRLTLEYLTPADTPAVPTLLPTPAFSDPFLVRDRLLKQGSFLAGNLEWFNCYDAPSRRAPLQSNYLTSAIKAPRDIVKNLAGLTRTDDKVGSMDDDANLVFFRESMVGQGNLFERLQTLPNLYTDAKLTRTLSAMPAQTLEQALHYRLNLDDGALLNEPYRWLIGFDDSVQALKPLHCSGRELSVMVTTSTSQMVFRLRLLPEAFAAGARLLSCHVESNTNSVLSLGLHLPDFPLWPSAEVSAPTALAWGDFTTDQVLSQGARQITITPPIRAQAFMPEDTLCADYCCTVQSEVYDVSGVVENGVDPRTGLFHAHYPIATLQGVEGLGPVVDLNLHYSARRANEGALGDGWAFRFSSFDNRLRLLTLSTGQTIQLTADEMYQLCARPDHVLDKGFCRVSHGIADGKVDRKLTCLSSLTITFLSQRVEVLAKPGTHDGEEASEQYRNAIKSRLDKIKSNLTHWIDKEDITDTQTKNFKSSRTAVQENIRDISRKAFILTPKSITSPQGGVLGLAWEGWKGHVRLLSIKSGNICLLQAVHEQPVKSGRYSSTFHVWPDSAEAYQVTLTIDDCLLRTLARKTDDQGIAVQQVHYGYQPDHALDRVLCSISEEDGSLEVVSYEPQVPRRKIKTRVADDHRHEVNRYESSYTDATSPEGEEDDEILQQAWTESRFRNEEFSTPLPRVARHTLVPGAGQETISHRWRWGDYDGDPRLSDAHFTSTETLESHALHGAPFTQRIWCVKNGMELPLRVVEETPGSLRRTTANTYPDSTSETDSRLKALLLSQPIATEISYEDLSDRATKEQQA